MVRGMGNLSDLARKAGASRVGESCLRWVEFRLGVQVFQLAGPLVLRLPLHLFGAPAGTRN